MKTRARRFKMVAILCLLSLSAAVIAARVTHPDTYELNIYAGTPLAFWILIGLTIIASLSLAMITDVRSWRIGFTAIFGAAVSLIIWLPFLRGYFFFDEFDAYSHLGTVLSILSGDVNPADLLYPGLHVVTGILTTVTNVPPRLALTATAVFIVTVGAFALALIPRSMTSVDKPTIGVISVALALLLTPINPLNVIIAPHPTTQAIFFAAFSLFVFFKLLSGPDVRLSICLAILLFALYTYHPQQILSFLFFTITVLIASDLVGAVTGRKVAKHKPYTVLFAGGVVMTMALTQHPSFRANLGSVAVWLVSGTSTGGVEGRVSSLEALNISLPVLALKIGANNIVLGIGIICALIAWVRNRPIGPVSPLPLIVGTLPVFALAVVLTVVGGINQSVRYIGMIMLLLTPLATLGYVHFQDYLETAVFERETWARVAMAGLLCLSLFAAIPTFYPSPYTERPGVHVTEGQHESFGDVLSYASDRAEFTFVRSRAFRYYHGIYGNDHETWPGYLPPRHTTGAPDHFEGVKDSETPTYLPVTEADRRRDAELYEGFRYSQDDFERLGSEPGVNNVYTSGKLDLYYIPAGNYSS